MLARVFAVLVAVCAFAARAADPELKFEKYRLQNGLTVILSEDRRLPQVSVNVWYHVGAANQTPGRSGFAHLFEHLMFSSTKHAKDPDQIWEAIGGSNLNGSTNFDRTNYYETVPSNELPTALWLESERMGFILPTLDQEKLRIQRDVVSNERRQRYENSPYGLAFIRTCDLLYPLPHPYYDCVIGNIAEIQAASLDNVRQFLLQYYGPNNASLTLVGDFDSANARQLIDKYFGPIPRGPDVPKPDVKQPLLTGVVHEKVEDKLAQLPRFEFIWNGLRQYDDEEAPGDILCDVLGSGRTSRLYQSMVLTQQVASGIDASDNTESLHGWISIGATARPGHTPDELRTLIQAAIDEVKKNGVTAEEVERAKRKIMAGRVRGLERTAARADLLNEYEMFLGNPGYLPRDIARYRAVTPEAVQAFAKKWLPDDRRIEMEIVPAGGRKEASR
ncbi:MAG: M16 family metallopeptidase [Myxococcales bacterium]